MPKKPKKDKPELPKKSGPGADKINDKFIKTVLSDLKKIRLGLNGKSPKGNQNLTDVTIKNDHQAFLVTKSVRDRLDLLVDLAQQQLQAQRETPSSRPNTSPDAGDFDSWFGHLQGKLQEICADVDRIESNTVGAGHHLGQIVLGVNFLNEKIAQHLVSMRELIDATKANAPATSSGSISIAPIVGKLDEIKTSIEPTVGKLDEIKQVLLAIQTSIQASMPEGAPASVEGRHEQSQEQKDVVLKQTKILEQIRDGVKDNSKSIESSKQSGSSEGGMGILGSLIRGAAITSALAIGVDLLGQAIWGKTAWEEVRKTFFDGLKTAIDATKTFVMTTLPKVLESAFKWIREEGPAIWETIKVGAKDTWKILKEGGNLMIEWIPIMKDTIVNMAEEISDIISEITAALKYFGFKPQETTREKRARIRAETNQAMNSSPTRPVQYQPTNVATREQIDAAAVFQNNQRNAQGDIDSLTDEDFANTPKTIAKILEADSKLPREVRLFNGENGIDKRNQAGQAIDAIRRGAEMPKNKVGQDIASAIVAVGTGGIIKDAFGNEDFTPESKYNAHKEHWEGKKEYNLDGTEASPEEIRLASMYGSAFGNTSQAENQATMFKSRGFSAKEIDNIQKGRQKTEPQVPEPKTFRDTSSYNGFKDEVPQNSQVPEASPIKGEKVSEALNMSSSNHFDSTVAQPTAVASNITNNNIMVNSGSSSTTGSQGADSSTVLYSLNNPETLAQQVAWDINRMSLA